MTTTSRLTAAAVSVIALVLAASGCAISPDPSSPPSTRSPLAAATKPGNDGTTDATPVVAPAPTPPALPPTAPPPTGPVPRVIVLDPGHSGTSIRSTARNGLRDIDYPNYPEIYEMFDVSICAARALRADGYRVLLTKKHTMSNVSHTARAAVANRNHADLALSVHDDHGVGPRFQATYDQRGLRRKDGSYPVMYRGKGVHRTVYRHRAVAKRSQRYARIIATERAQAQRRPVKVTQNSYNNRAPLEPGNLALVQLFSEVPWVYNEMGALTRGSTTRAMSITSETRYAQGLVDGVAAAVPLVDGKPNPPTESGKGLRSCLVKRVQPKPGQLTRPKRYLPYGFTPAPRP